ncbi:hypothetical protein BX616_000060 [Lobosporangium transversale]|nr:hypothetical protein BX616_000060 [Lobosporangium transversale]
MVVAVPSHLSRSHSLVPNRTLMTFSQRNINRPPIKTLNSQHIYTIPKLQSAIPWIVAHAKNNIARRSATTTATTASRIGGTGHHIHPKLLSLVSSASSRLVSGTTRGLKPSLSLPQGGGSRNQYHYQRLLFRHQQQRQLLSRLFHSSRPNQFPAPLLPVALFTLKTPIVAMALRMISRISLTLLPLSAKRSPKVILALVMTPPICFALVIFAGLEAAPNTGRWRFLFTSEEEELAMLEDEIPMFLESIKVVNDDSDERVQLVKHILKNLLSASIEQDGSTLRTGIVEKLEKKYQEAQAKLKEKQLKDAAENKTMTASSTSVSDATTAIVSTQRPVLVSGIPSEGGGDVDDNNSEEDDPELRAFTFEERPFQIFVVEDDTINAFSLGPPRLIFINSGLMKWLDNDEDLIAAVVAHELAHVIQRHTMETHGRETIMLFLAGPWFNSWVDETTSSLLHFTASGPLHQAIEVEADTVSLTLLALAGYDPMHAVRLWELWAEKDQMDMVAEDSVDVHKWTDWMYDHPPSAERARYLKDAVMPAREMWQKILQRRKVPMERFVPLEIRLKQHTDEDGDLKDGTVEDVMETMDDLLEKQEEEEKKRRGFRGTLRRWAEWRPWANTSNEIGSSVVAEHAKA